MVQEEWRAIDMIVYHGSNSDIDVINLSKGIRYKDFGQGFYVTPNIETAKRMAEKKARFYGGEETIIEYEFDESSLNDSNLKVLVFPERATAEWITFIAKNRDRHNTANATEYDIIKGPIADDGVAIQLGRLRVHAEQAEMIALDLQDKYLDQQICFRTEQSLNYLKKTSVCRLK